MKTVSSSQELVRVIGVNCSNFSASNAVVKIKIWDNRIVTGSNYEGSESPEIVSSGGPRVDSNLLWSHVKSLLNSGRSFIVRNGSSDIEWTISNN